MTYNEENIEELYKAIKGAKLDDRLKHEYECVSEAIQVHTKGLLFRKIIDLFPNEEEHNHKQVVDSFEPVTKDGIWKGINNISRIITGTSYQITASERTNKELESENFVENYNRQWIDKSVSCDPNSLGVWVYRNKKWVFEIIETQLVKHIDKDRIIFIDKENSEYTVKTKDKTLYRNPIMGQDKSCESFRRKEEYDFTRTSYVYISKTLYVQITELPPKEDEKEAQLDVTPVKLNLQTTPYSRTGTVEISDGVYHSPIEPFIPWGNLTLLTFRGFINATYNYAYPIMEEPELPCSECMSSSPGKAQCGCDSGTDCDTCHGSGICECKTCKGSGFLSVRSLFKDYKRKVYPEGQGVGNDYPSAKFITPDTQIFEYLKQTPFELLEKAEKSVYVQKMQETGQAQSAEAREQMLQEMYSWLKRLAEIHYQNQEQAITIRQQLDGDYGNVSIERPISYAIISEVQAFEILKNIVSSDSPLFLKNNQILSFVDKYFSKSNPIHKAIKVLKRVDLFAFHNSKDFEDSGSFGDISEDYRFIHVHAYPLLMRLLDREPQLAQLEVEDITDRLEQELSNLRPTNTIRNRVQSQLEE